MNYRKEELKEQFEKEVWLYLDKDLPIEKIKFWDEKLKENIFLNEILNDILFITEKYNRSNKISIDDKHFDEMINNTIKHKTLRKTFSQFFAKIKQANRNVLNEKLAFGLTLAIMLLVFFAVRSRKSNLIENVSLKTDNDLAWEPEAITRQINKLDTMIKFAQNDNLEKYYMYKIVSDQWNKNTLMIKSEIKRMKNELDNNKF